ncbi:MAG: hypothetical protein A2029_09405 [Chloroflexi bacterium RBG_19FT_COMBO_47_9]|nr:MAG: hypothetical protein A2029_09405 [Chloroflexi bacterium RBG_19FT_COMBO_47_9]
MKPVVKQLLRRVALLLLVSIVFVLGLSELVYRLQKEDTSRGPKRIELVIPEGTGIQIANGEDVQTLPDEMVFVIGDTLVIENQDTVDHQLGPLWIPAKSTASLQLDESNEYAYACSFKSSKYIGLTVRQPVTWKSRLDALWYGVPPTLMFLLVYSFAVRPLNVRS